MVIQIIKANPKANFKISCGVSNTLFSDCLIAWTDKAICFLAFTNNNNITSLIKEMKELWHNSNFSEDTKDAKNLITDIFLSKKQDIKLQVTGSEFQIKVWEAMLGIPFGTTTNYEEVAIKIGGRNYTRPTASAIAKNNISYLIPCHRVIHKSGNINKYRWGKAIKNKLLAWENEKSI